MQALVAAAPRVDFGLDRGRRGGEHDRDFRDARAHHRHVAGVVVHAVLLLVGAVVLLIDDDQAEIGIRQEQRRARAHDDARLARRDRRPGARAHARRELRVPFGRAHAEARGEAVEELRGERDLRHQDQRLPAAPDGFGDRLEIDLGLARAGDAVDQGRRIAAARDARAQGIRGLALRRREIGLHEIRIGRARHRLGRQHQRLQRAFIHQPVDDAGRNAGLLRRLALAAHEPVGEQRQHAVARRRHPLRRGAREPHADALARRPELLGAPQAHAQHHAAGAERVGRDPVDEAAQLGLERRDVELLLDLLEAVVEARIGIGVLGPDHAGRQRVSRAARRRRRRAPAPSPPAPGRNRPGRARPAAGHRRRVWPWACGRFGAVKEG